LILTKFCVEIAKIAGVKRVVAETTRDNKGMITVFRKTGFKVHFNEDGTVTTVMDID
jgi:acetyltransferase